MNNRGLSLYFISLVFACIGASCGAGGKTPIPFTIPATETAGLNFSATPPRPTMTPIPSSTWTPLPTLSFDESHVHYLNLLETNVGCLLPCWWGIIPGKTTWQDARQYLEMFSMIINDVDASKEMSGVAVHLPVSKNQGTLTHTYYVRDGIVYWITAFNFDLATPLYLSNFMNTYGPPDEVFFRVFYPGHQEKKFSFLFDLYYTEGILIEYIGGDETLPINGIHKNCYSDMKSPFIYLWSSGENMTAVEAINTFLDNRNFPYPIPLKDATNMDVTQFYDEFRNSDIVKCLETNQELWQ